MSALAWGLSLDVPLDVALAFTLVGWKVDPSAKRLDLDVVDIERGGCKRR